ncbi:MAG: glycosyltransferase family 4 protein [Desulfovibrio sp.]|jgi:glycosyltransferase involved in cell wall biosynthesis|nr:glycosyltransferase family 4 protein [Desulfovibrio sp.]
MLAAYDLNIAEHCGIDRYNRELLGRLPKLRKDFRATTLPGRNASKTAQEKGFRSVSPQEIAPGRHQTASIPLNRNFPDVLRNFVYAHIRAGEVLRRMGADIFHCTKNYTVPAFASCAIVTTVHDVIPLALSREYSASFPHVVWYRYNYGCSVRRSKRLIVISKFTGDELLRFHPACRGKIRVIPLGCDPEFGACHGPESARAAMLNLGVEGPYVLSMGGAEPRKNVQQLIGAFTLAPPKHHCLVIVGNRWRDRILHIPAGAPVHILCGLSQSDLAAAYTAASAFVFPSLYEGFGLPVLEAMACGVPVLVHNGAALPEVAGAAALTVDMRDGAACMAALRKVLSERSLADELRAAGRERVGMFSWEKTARLTAEVYDEALSA